MCVALHAPLCVLGDTQQAAMSCGLQWSVPGPEVRFPKIPQEQVAPLG